MSKKKRTTGQAGEKRIRLSEDLLWGIHPIYEGLEKEPERFSELILQKDRHGEKIEKIIERARDAGVKISFTDSVRLTGEGSSQARHQGVVARLSQTSLISLETLLDKLAQYVADGKRCRIVALDSLQDPHNVGAIIRSAYASGAVAVVVTRERSAPLGGTAAKSSAGSMSHIDICQVTNLSEALKKIKKAGLWVFGAVKDDSAVSLFETDLTVPGCVVIGSEGKGIRPLVKKECDVLLSIPMEGSLDSLNSSVAAGVILFEMLRQNVQLKL
ncbi:23S rRNA (guanosine(2251)-2'-O)-methyltransferase RlmB [Desulforhopalus singaporensis]|uniref:23S rRNA (Guanosine2251-2'-O)-methyltransferase n=1 Tax=Desulforhopalus singaporensis TaxID=91360 RepID=A0A1H0TH77_9BACT|nr:23S rRNA (guanosine(2251)-2'-O)-methyltransferase RlmB [Desulforhopalus singaporensis]SDP53349.1 23S rRNA (guanosine2251-2'-O)-methyltransferase [Desulforhopalus singaporensis]